MFGITETREIIRELNSGSIRGPGVTNSDDANVDIEVRSGRTREGDFTRDDAGEEMTGGGDTNALELMEFKAKRLGDLICDELDIENGSRGSNKTRGNGGGRSSNGCGLNGLGSGIIGRHLEIEE